MATTAELQTQVLAHQFNSSRYSDAIIDWLDEGQKHICRQTDMREMEILYSFSTAAGTAEYAAPSDFMRLISVVDKTDTSNNVVLVSLTLDEYDTANKVSQGKPQGFIVKGSDTVLGTTSLYIYPTPDAAYSITLRYYRVPTTITSSVDPSIPDDYHDLLVHYALWRAYGAEHDYEAADWHRSYFDQMILKMRGEVQYDAFKGPASVSGAWNGLY